jgi:hypothetical protein
MDEYVPSGVREGAIDPGVLIEGVPSYMRQSLTDWIGDALRDLRGSPYMGQPPEWVLSEERLKAVERHCRVTLDWTHEKYSALSSLQHLADLEASHQTFIWAIDYACGNGQGASPEDLETILRDGGSAWRVSEVGVPHLERRVPEGVVVGATEVIAKSGEAGKLLAQAWGDMYGVKPDPSEAYRHAIRATEAAAVATVSPKHLKATLGTMIGDMRSTPNKWTVTTEGDHSLESIIAMMETMWTGQTDRHGIAGGEKSLIPGSAEVAVHLAVALVGLFAGGSIKTV